MMKVDKFLELSASTVTFISCRGRLTKVLAGAARGETGIKGGVGQVRIGLGIGILKLVDMPFHIGSRHGRGWHLGVCE